MLEALVIHLIAEWWRSTKEERVILAETLQWLVIFGTKVGFGVICALYVFPWLLTTPKPATAINACIITAGDYQRLHVTCKQHSIDLHLDAAPQDAIFLCQQLGCEP